MTPLPMETRLWRVVAIPPRPWKLIGLVGRAIDDVSRLEGLTGDGRW